MNPNIPRGRFVNKCLNVVSELNNDRTYSSNIANFQEDHKTIEEEIQLPITDVNESKSFNVSDYNLVRTQIFVKFI